MTIAANSVVAIHYLLTDERGVTLDASAPDQPLVYLHGAGNLIPALERELTGRGAGEHFTAVIPPREAYGERVEELVQEVPRNLFREDQDVAVGMRFSGSTPQGPISVVVTGIEGDRVTLDGNHPLAGKTLHFEVTIAAVRAATEEELRHGHLHGPGCRH
ncbi:MAG: FKBP-type peptidyl-prolyl cis-trans isomerase [Pseudomonadota bacterium]|jgi:FKBP-type peptidyl-prolyl cis-trans isomerase SlyD